MLVSWGALIQAKLLAVYVASLLTWYMLQWSTLQQHLLQHTANLTVVDLVTLQATLFWLCFSFLRFRRCFWFWHWWVCFYHRGFFFLLTIMLFCQVSSWLWQLIIILQHCGWFWLYNSWLLFDLRLVCTSRNNSDSAKTGSGCATAWSILSQLKLFCAADSYSVATGSDSAHLKLILVHQDLIMAQLIHFCSHEAQIFPQLVFGFFHSWFRFSHKTGSGWSVRAESDSPKGGPRYSYSPVQLVLILL